MNTLRPTNNIRMWNVTGTTSTVLRDSRWGRRRITGQSKGLPAMGICNTTMTIHVLFPVVHLFGANLDNIYIYIHQERYQIVHFLVIWMLPSTMSFLRLLFFRCLLIDCWTSCTSVSLHINGWLLFWTCIKLVDTL